MILPKLDVARRRMYPAWLRPAFGVTSFLFGLALANLLLEVFTNKLDAAAITVTGGFAALFFIGAGLHAFLSRPSKHEDQHRIVAWAEARYDIQLTLKQAARLTRPSSARGIPFPGWVSFPIAFFQKDMSGMRRLIHLLLLRADDDYILFCPEAGGEYPVSPKLIIQENQDFMEEAWKEMDEHGGIYILTPDQDYFHGDMVRARAPEGKDIALLWSDRLRADLWLNEDTDNKSQEWSVSYLPLNDVYNELLPAMVRENQSVGLNWGDGTRAYDAHWFAQKMGQRFKDLMHP